MKKLILYSCLLASVALSCTYENEEEAYAVKESEDPKKSTLNDSLVAYFKFDNNLADSSVNGLALKLDGTTDYTTDGHKSSALNLDGNSSVSISAGVYDTLTICFWMKNSDELKNLSPANSSPTVFDYGSGMTKFEIDAISGATYISLTAGGNGTVFNGDEEFINSWKRWGFVLIEIVDKQISKFFYSGTLSRNFKPQAGVMSIQNGTLIVGKASDSANSYFKGAIDELRVYKRALKSNEVNALKAQ